MDQTYETMYHTYDFSQLFVCINQKHLQDIFFRAKKRPRERSKRQGLERFELRIGLGSRNESRKGRTGVGSDGFEIQWVQLTPAIFLGCYPQEMGFVMDLLIEKYGLPGPRLGLVFVRFLSLSHGPSDLREATALELAVA